MTDNDREYFEYQLKMRQRFAKIIESRIQQLDKEILKAIIEHKENEDKIAALEEKLKSYETSTK